MKNTARSFKTVLACILALMLLMSTFTGCAAQEGTSGKQETSTTQKEDNHKNDKEKNMKRIWSVYSFILWYNKYFVEN